MPYPVSTSTGAIQRGSKGFLPRTSNATAKRDAAGDSGADVENWLKGLDDRRENYEFEKIPQAVKDLESKTGLDPETIIPFLGNRKSFWLDAKAGLLDALYGAAATGAGMLGAVPSPKREEFRSQRDILKNRQNILRNYLSRVNDGGRSLGTAVSRGSEMAGNLVNPAGRLGLVNAAYHGARGYAKDDSIADAIISGGSNMLGEAAEGVLTKVIPGIRNFTGLPGNMLGAGVIEPAANAAKDAVDDSVKKRREKLVRAVERVRY
jgi:hypothetical protein